MCNSCFEGNNCTTWIILLILLFILFSNCGCGGSCGGAATMSNNCGCGC